MSVKLEDLIKLEIKRMQSVIETENNRQDGCFVKSEIIQQVNDIKIISEYLEELLVMYNKINKK